MHVLKGFVMKGGKKARVAKVLTVALLLYWVIRLLPDKYRVLEGFISITLYYAYIFWLKHRQAENLRVAGMDVIDQMEGVEFEQRMLLHFQGAGWKAKPTRTSGDFGADLLLTDPTGRKVVAQCKRYDASVGVEAVQEAVAAIRYYTADSAMVITNSHLTAAAKKLAVANDVEVWERARLAQKLASVDARTETIASRTKLLWNHAWRR